MNTLCRLFIAGSVLLLFSVLVVQAEEHLGSSSSQGARVTSQGVVGHIADGVYRGHSGQQGASRVELEFRVQNHHLYDLRFIELQHGRHDFLRGLHDPWVLGVSTQYQAAIEHLEGRPLEAIYQLLDVYTMIGPDFELLEICSSVDGASAATVRGNAVMDAILNGLSQPVLSVR